MGTQVGWFGRGLLAFFLVGFPLLSTYQLATQGIPYLFGKSARLIIVDEVVADCARRGGSDPCLRPIVEVEGVRVRLAEPRSSPDEPGSLDGRRVDVRWPEGRPADARNASNAWWALGVFLASWSLPALVLFARRRARLRRVPSPAEVVESEAELSERLSTPVSGRVREARVHQLDRLVEAARALVAGGGDAAWLSVAEYAERMRDEPFTPRDLQDLRTGLPPTQSAADDPKALDAGDVLTHHEQALVPLLARVRDAAADLTARV